MTGKKIQDIQLTNHKCCAAAIEHWAAPRLGQGLWGDTSITPSTQWVNSGRGNHCNAKAVWGWHGKAMSGRVGADRSILSLAQPL